MLRVSERFLCAHVEILNAKRCRRNCNQNCEKTCGPKCKETCGKCKHCKWFGLPRCIQPSDQPHRLNGRVVGIDQKHDIVYFMPEHEYAIYYGEPSLLFPCDA